MTQKMVLAIASVFGFFAVILGAFGAHAFKKILTADKLASFETGVKYQLYHALVLLFVGMYFSMEKSTEKTMAWFFVVGTLLFSVSIYFLSFGEYWKVNLKFLGPITPIGGLLMILGWALLFWNVWKR